MGWSFVGAYTIAFSMWSVHAISGEIEQPFGDDLNDIDFPAAQRQMNDSLLKMLDLELQQAPMGDVDVFTNQDGDGFTTQISYGLGATTKARGVTKYLRDSTEAVAADDIGMVRTKARAP